MKVLVINCGSSSLKYQLIDMDTEKLITKGNYERIGQPNSVLGISQNGEKKEFENPAKNHELALEYIMKILTGSEYGVLKSLDEIGAIGHRVVHGGEKFSESVLITEDVEKEIENCIPLAPLHNPACLFGIRACKKNMPGKPMVAVFDTAFHQTMPIDNYIYPIPYEYYEKYKIRKYGFHGTSHLYVSNRVAEVMKKDIKDLKIVTCHLGQGASLCAVKGGKSINTSMGLTPLGGIPMCSRCGDMDPSLVKHLMDTLNISIDEVMTILNKQSGAYGISDVTPDFRDIEKASLEGDKKAILAIDFYCRTVAEYIARYAVSMNGIDVIVFTAGIGENQYNLRKKICDNLEFLGLELDGERNKVRSEEQEISSDKSKIKVYVIPTNEELVIARDTKRLTK